MNKVIDMLNAAFESDPQAIHALMCNRVPCSTGLMYDEHVVVYTNTALEGEAFAVGTLGILNGVLSCLGLPNIAMKWSVESPNKFLGFCEANNPTTEPSEIDKLHREIARLRSALKQYANKDNWGYYDDSGCQKGTGLYTDAYFIGPEIAREALGE